jgi:glycogenin glucosyltransferase
LARPELGVTFTKINCWLLEKYSKCVFLDADVVVLRNIDDLFEREEFSAAPDAGWPDCFNSGVFVYKPSAETFRKLTEFASQQDASFDGGDQGLLNAFFSNWRSSDISRHLPFTYNVTSNTFYSYVPAVTQFRNDIRVVHFAGALKPWQLTYNPQTEQLSGNLGGQHEIQREFLLAWWKVMHERVWPQLSKNNQQSASNQSIGESPSHGEFSFDGSLLNYGSLTNDQGVQTGSAAHRRAWEAGHVDYHGRDSFTNIQEQLERNIAHQPQQYHPSQQRQTTPPQSTSASANKTEQQSSDTSGSITTTAETQQK